MAEKILVVDDERPIADILKFNLERAGYQVETAYDGDEALQVALADLPDLIILDIMLPGKDGFEVCREIRRRSAVPIIMLTAKEAETDKIQGLDEGADDYVTKPFSPAEVVARVRALLRRSQGSMSVNNAADHIYCGHLTIDLKGHQVLKGEQQIELTTREFELLKYLAQHPGQVFSRETLLEDVWGYRYHGDIRTVDVTIRRLREKIEEHPGDPRFILTKRGAGYYFRKF
ncbi:MAG TPA: response regulator [Sphingobacteriaceae bacterium]|nr:response regulator [Sphingobacteriaceae bacterium]